MAFLFLFGPFSWEIDSLVVHSPQTPGVKERPEEDRGVLGVFGNSGADGRILT